ncbi:threonine transporter RhtB [Dictyobacter vulcani]|uniref:Threonine transporter RhtB n=1 Tax=Dictyobacter vulcani TaxID=2607529 RepID=A0A5J4KWZ4_9CHLR|nr:DMT family transporter [Dictyobacter vulcani]GER91060.1 threonine transporter RhtB [Dictyobacter vulcani]
MQQHSSSLTETSPVEKNDTATGNLLKRIPPQIFALLAMISVQLGASVSKSLFQIIGPLGTTLLRLGFAALFLMLFWRPDMRKLTRSNILLVVAFGVAIACMNSAFYIAIDRIPLGIAVTLEFVGPLGVAIIQSRRLKDVIWVVLAAIGIVLLAPLGSAIQIDLIGVACALIAGIFWGLYIIFNVRIGRAFSGGQGLALSMLVAACVSAPIGIINGGPAVFAPQVLIIGLGVSILSTIIPFTLELEALRRLPSRVFGIFMSVEPGLATIIGFVVLHEVITLREILAILLIITASIGTSLEGKSPH